MSGYYTSLQHQRRRRGAVQEEEPRTRIGLCCGEACRRSAKRRGRETSLYRVSASRYRCAACFKRETGFLP